jgi:hypothetical protein
MGHILEKIKFFFLLLFYMDLYYKAIVWVIFWRILKKNVCVSVWTYTINMGLILEKIKEKISCACL